MRTQDEILADIDEAEDRKRAAFADISRLKQELGEAILRDTAPHEWFGRKVKRTVRNYRRTSIQRGVVCQQGPTRGTGFRGYWPDPGENFVKSASGIAAYSLTQSYKAGPWELDE